MEDADKITREYALDIRYQDLVTIEITRANADRLGEFIEPRKLIERKGKATIADDEKELEAAAAKASHRTRTKSIRKTTRKRKKITP